MRTLYAGFIRIYYDTGYNFFQWCHEFKLYSVKLPHSYPSGEETPENFYSHNFTVPDTFVASDYNLRKFSPAFVINTLHKSA